MFYKFIPVVNIFYRVANLLKVGNPAKQGCVIKKQFITFRFHLPFLFTINQKNRCWPAEWFNFGIIFIAYVSK